MKVWKRGLSLLMTLSMVLTLLPGSVLAAEVDQEAEIREATAVQENLLSVQDSLAQSASGTCGDNLTWTLTADGVLTISGTGEMTEYPTSSSTPWSDYRDSIHSVRIADGVTSISKNAFQSQTNLCTVEISDSVTRIGETAFLFCYSLREITVSAWNPAYCSVDGVLFDKNMNTLLIYPIGKPDTFYTIPQGVTCIGAYAFDRCIGLNGVEIPAGVTTLSNCAFRDCENLQSIVIPNGVTSIGTSAFSGCIGLTRVEIPDSATSIGSYVFSGCKSLIQVEIPRSWTIIPDGAFQNCHGLTNVEIPIGVTSIETCAFNYCKNLNYVKIPDGVRDIGRFAFEACQSLARVEIPGSVTSIAEGAFYRCRSLTEVYFEGNAPGASSNGAVSPSFPGEVTLFYPEGASGWTDSSAYNAVAGTWNGYKLAVWEGTPEEKPFSAETSVTVSTGVAGVKPVLDDVKWEDQWFEELSTTYNHELARTSMVLSAAAYVSAANMKEVWPKFGFESENIETHYPKSATKENNDFVAYSFAAKELSGKQEGMTLIAIAIRGTPSTGEWFSNFNIGRDGTEHAGFSLSAEKLWNDLDVFIEKVKKDGFVIDQNTKFLITGHSRGGGVANLIAAGLIQDKYYAKEHVFAYTFATPSVSELAVEEGYENIFNILNDEDFVTRVPLKKWGLARFGVDLRLPSRSFYSSKTYDDISAEMEKAFVAMTGKDEFHPYKNGTQDVQKLIKKVLSVSPDREAYYDAQQVFYAPPTTGPVKMEYKSTYEYFTVLATFLALPTGSEEEKEALGELIQSMTGDFAGITWYFVQHEKINQRVFDAHCPALYLGWMRSCTADELFGKNNKETYPSYKQLTVTCPVDVYVYNEDGSLVASVVNEEVVVDTLAVSVQDGVKVVDLPADQKYRVEIMAREAGSVDYSVEEKSVDDAIDTSRTVLFNDITIAKGDKLVGEITADSETQVYFLTRNEDQVIQADYDLDSEGLPATMFVAAYRNSGQMIGCYSREITFVGPNAEYGISKRYGDVIYKVFYLDNNQKPLCGGKILPQ